MMTSPHAEQAIADARTNGRALLKFISPNDAGVTGSHQCGFYLPSGVWEFFTPQAPVNGINHKHIVSITWQNGLITESAVTWYGKGTRHEYRLTRFGRDFPFLNADAVGNLLVLVPISLEQFHAYVLDLEDDIEQVQAALGVEAIDSWGVFEPGREHVEDEDECLERHFRKFAAELEDFPSGLTFSEATRTAIRDCVQNLARMPHDKRLVQAINAEYRLFRLVERRLCNEQIHRMFESVDDFLKTAGSITNRRKARAGRSFENHVEFILKDAGVPHESQPAIDGKPDFIIPSVEAYNDPSYPVDRLFVVGLKTTCKDRWRQVLNEGQRVPTKHLLTLQKGISGNQLAEMSKANVSLVVPQPLHKEYPKERAMDILSIDRFISDVQERL
jgi:type II restriction enzyme